MQISDRFFYENKPFQIGAVLHPLADHRIRYGVFRRGIYFIGLCHRKSPRN